MQINNQTLAALQTGLKTSFRLGFEGYGPMWSRVATKVTSTAKMETYGWLGDFPKMREWIGDRVIKSLDAKAYTLINRDFESTIGVRRNDIDDDQLGLYGPMAQEMGRSAAQNPDDLVFGALSKGFETECYDGQNFFDTDHPVGFEGNVQSVSNVQAGAGPAWYLMDVTRALKPLIYQQRKAADFTAMDDRKDENVFMRKEYLYGVETRENAGFGFWQMAFASKAALNAENFEASRTTMMSFKDDAGKLLGVNPRLLVVPPSLEGTARRLLERELIDGGNTNEWKGAAELLVCPLLP